MEQAQERYEVFHIIPTDTFHGREAKVQQAWRDLLGERALLLADAGAVCETIALTIGLCEGTVHSLDQGQADLVDAGYDAGDTTTAVTALVPFAAGRGPLISVAAGILPSVQSGGLDGRF